jgi:transcriptional regulator with XRE-family HTH domain
LVKIIDVVCNHQSVEIFAMMLIRITGSQLHAARVLVGLSREEVAERAGLCRHSIRKWETSSDAIPGAITRSSEYSITSRSAKSRMPGRRRGDRMNEANETYRAASAIAAFDAIQVAFAALVKKGILSKAEAEKILMQAIETIKTGGAGDQAAELLAIADPTQLPAQSAFL